MATGRVPGCCARCAVDVGSTRWLHRFGSGRSCLDLALLAPVASYGAYRIGGWGAAAAVAMVLGVGALVLQPSAYVGRPLSRAWRRRNSRKTRLLPCVALRDAARDLRRDAACRCLPLRGDSSNVVSADARILSVSGTDVPDGAPWSECSRRLDNAMSTYVPFGLMVIFPRLLGRAYSAATQEFLAASTDGGPNALRGRRRVPASGDCWHARTDDRSVRRQSGAVRPRWCDGLDPRTHRRKRDAETIRLRARRAGRDVHLRRSGPLRRPANRPLGQAPSVAVP